MLDGTQILLVVLIYLVAMFVGVLVGRWPLAKKAKEIDTLILTITLLETRIGIQKRLIAKMTQQVVDAYKGQSDGEDKEKH
jgi:hypothetical protein